MKGKDDCPVCELWLSEGRLDLDTRVGEGVEPKLFPTPHRQPQPSMFRHSQRELSEGFPWDIPFSNADHSTTVARSHPLPPFNHNLGSFGILRKQSPKGFPEISHFQTPSTVGNRWVYCGSSLLSTKHCREVITEVVIHPSSNCSSLGNLEKYKSRSPVLHPPSPPHLTVSAECIHQSDVIYALTAEIMFYCAPH